MESSWTVSSILFLSLKTHVFVKLYNAVISKLNATNCTEFNLFKMIVFIKLNKLRQCGRAELEP